MRLKSRASMTPPVNNLRIAGGSFRKLAGELRQGQIDGAAGACWRQRPSQAIALALALIERSAFGLQKWVCAQRRPIKAQMTTS